MESTVSGLRLIPRIGSDGVGRRGKPSFLVDGSRWWASKGKPFSSMILRDSKGSATKKKKKERVVIVGSGWAGYALARKLDPSKFERIVISPRSHFVFTPLLASTAVGTLEFRSVLEPVRGLGVSFHQGRADEVDFEGKVVHVEANVGDDTAARTLPPPPPPPPLPAPQASTSPPSSSAADGTTVLPHPPPATRSKGPMISVPYDKLVVAVGSYSQTFGVPGVREHAHFLRDVGDARRIRLKVLSLFERCATTYHDPPDGEGGVDKDQDGEGKGRMNDAARRELLHFAVVGGGPTGIEFAAELHDLVHEDLARIYPLLAPLVRITVYDIAPSVLPMFDRELAGYATELFRRKGIRVRTEHHLEGIRDASPGEVGHGLGGLKLSVREKHRQQQHDEGGVGVGVGMVVWSTGLMQNPLVTRLVAREFRLPPADDGQQQQQLVGPPLVARLQSDPKTGGIVTDGHMRARLQVVAGGGEDAPPAVSPPGGPRRDQGVLEDVFVIGDCSVVESDRTLPKTAQVASQQAVYLAKRLNRGAGLGGRKKEEDEGEPFSFRNWGTMAYLGGWRAIHQRNADELKGWAAWVLWRTAYLTKSMSVRNKFMVPVYWFASWLFGRDISRF